MPKAFREKTFALPWGKIAAKVWGPDGGKPVLALHGWLDNAGSFDRLLPRLPEWNIVAVDLPGHGLSAHRPAGSYYSFLDWVTDTTDILEQLSWRKYSLLGHSLGAAVAGVVAAVRAGETERLVLLEGIGPMTSPDERLPERVALFLSERNKLVTKKLPVYADRIAAGKARQSVGEMSWIAIECLLGRGTRPTDGGVTWSSDPRLRLPTPHRLNEPQTRALLAGIACPTLLVRASHGLEIPDGVWEARAKCVSRLTEEKVEGNHHVHLENPERVAPLIARFFS